jgi:putative ABC transport system permease protein
MRQLFRQDIMKLNAGIIRRKNMSITSLLTAMPGNVAQGIIWGIMALGVFMTYKLLNFADLTVDGSFATGGAVTVILITSGWSVPSALVMAFAAGILAGMVTGLLHTVLGIPDILSGILSQIALYSINLNIMSGKANVAVSVDKYPLLVSLRFVPRSILVSAIFAAALIALMYWYFGTAQGCAIRATGCNPAMSRAQGINIDLMKVITLALSNGVVALSGGLLSQFQGFADINMGRGAIVIGLAAVIIGEVLGHALFGKRMNFVIRMLFVVLGGVIYYIVIGIVLWLRMPTNDLKLFTAIIVAVFLAVPYLKGKANNSFKKAAKKGAQENA